MELFSFSCFIFSGNEVRFSFLFIRFHTHFPYTCFLGFNLGFPFRLTVPIAAEAETSRYFQVNLVLPFAFVNENEGRNQEKENKLIGRFIRRVCSFISSCKQAKPCWFVFLVLFRLLCVSFQFIVTVHQAAFLYLHVGFYSGNNSVDVRSLLFCFLRRINMLLFVYYLFFCQNVTL